MYKALIKPFFQDAKQFVLDTLFPIHCLVCGKQEDFICSKCKPALCKLENQYCIVCQKPSVGGITHPYCQTPYGADGLISVFNYHDENIKNIIIKGKYSFIPGIYKILGSLMANEMVSNYKLLTTNYQLVPIPLFSWRQRWRGFNQAKILCEVISKEFNLPVADVLKRKKMTKVQKDIKKKEERARNMSGAFELKKHYPFSLEGEGGSLQANRMRGNEADKSRFDIHDQNFILIDDVVTTGSTLSEATKVLKRNGAGKVWCLTVARD